MYFLRYKVALAVSRAARFGAMANLGSAGEGCSPFRSGNGVRDGLDVGSAHSDRARAT